MGSHSCEERTSTLPFEKTFCETHSRANSLQAKAGKSEWIARESQRAVDEIQYFIPIGCKWGHQLTVCNGIAAKFCARRLTGTFKDCSRATVERRGKRSGR